MNPKVKYTFKSHKGGAQVTITSRMGEDSARSAAMEYFWGAPNNVWIFNGGLGLDLVERKEVEEV